MATREVTKQEDVIQAVVIADSFNDKFAPLDSSTPKVLLPLVNWPILEYTLQFLKAAGVQETFLICCSQADKIKEYIKNSKWGSGTCSMQLTTIISESSTSVGDALRDIDAKALIRNDFILVMGDTVSNVQLKPILEAHKERRKKDKGAVMTMIYKGASAHHRTVCPEDRTVLAVDHGTDRLLYFKRAGDAKKFAFDLELFQNNGELRIRYDLLDCHMAVCSLQVPPLFSDNFDFQTTDDFTRGILENEEILGNSLHVNVIEGECYAARVSNITMYDALSRDVMDRWVYPLVPDLTAPYGYQRHNVYKHKETTLARGSILEENVILGRGTKVGSNTRISNSVVGSNCQIGDNVTIEDSYLWDTVTVGEGCSVSTAILANGVTLFERVRVNRGCVLAAKVKIGPDVTLKEGSVFTADEDDDGEVDLSVVGSRGKAYAYVADEDSDGEDEAAKDGWWTKDDRAVIRDSDTGSEDLSDRESPLPDDTKLFYNEVLDSLTHGVDEDIACENLVLEVNSSKYAYNVTMRELNALTVKAILEIHAARVRKQAEVTEYLARLVQLFDRLLPFVRNYIKNSSSQMDLLTSLEEFFDANSTYVGALAKLLQYFYDKDVLSEDAILAWHKDPDGSRVVRTRVFPFIRWLEEAEEESDSD